LRITATGEAICTLRLATTDKWTDRANNESRENTEWHRVLLLRRLAEIAGDYLKKGSQVYVEGRIRTRKWQDKEGKERYTTEIEGGEMRMLGTKGTGPVTASSALRRLNSADGYLQLSDRAGLGLDALRATITNAPATPLKRQPKYN
jgi:single stranded DNA-binding protein